MLDGILPKCFEPLFCIKSKKIAINRTVKSLSPLIMRIEQLSNLSILPCQCQTAAVDTISCFELRVLQS